MFATVHLSVYPVTLMIVYCSTLLSLFASKLEWRRRHGPGYTACLLESLTDGLIETNIIVLVLVSVLWRGEFQ